MNEAIMNGAIKHWRSRTTHVAHYALLLAPLLLALGCAHPPSNLAVPSHAVIGVQEEHLQPDYWVERARNTSRVVLNESAIATQNARLQSIDPTFHDLQKIPAQLEAAQLRKWITDLSIRPTSALFNERGEPIATTQLDQVEANLALDTIRTSQPTRYGLVVQRANLRTFPTALRVFRSDDDADIDRFQESALFPGTPVVIAHTSRDGEWYFVVSQLYAAWVEKQYVAEGTAQAVFQYTQKSPYLIVTGATARTVFTRERPELSELQLEMGTRVPLIADWPKDRLVNGQHPYTSYVVELPWRDRNGALAFSAALIPKTQDVASNYLTLNRANLLQQSFKFLGERYGWGHSYNARDCSGFVSEVYRSFGLQMPRNTRDQGTSPALERIEFDENDTYDERLTVIRTLQIGDLLYIPGHVMMVIGHENGTPYVIHDTTGISYRDGDGDGEIRRVSLNGVSVTPLTPLLLTEDRSLIEQIYSIVLMRKR
jgi:cell wall-associated NlpC family hydrolase